ncbi:hypothetical protein GCM10022419_070690 [Nonomuraea rosea]|uniref:Ig-like domain repeat protein n=1 Tax=Nonomuraea rosea TaxID=638574 RepID=A0ABP6Y8B6_9ACTN
MPVSRLHAPLVTAATGLAIAAAAVLPAAAAHAEQTLLTCQVSTTSQRPLTFSPPVGFLPRTVTAQATLELSGCTGTGPSASGLRSGLLTAQGTGRASCSGVQDIKGKGRIVWFGQDGSRAGVSTLRPSPARVQTYNPGDMLLSGQISKGPLAGSRTTGTATPTSNISICATKGLSTVYGSGKITFLGA